MSSTSDARQLWLRDRLLESGTVYLTSTQFQGRRYLRLVFMNPATTLDDIVQVLMQLTRLEVECPID